MLRELFKGSLPVFVAAAISRSSMSLIELASNTDTAAIWITFVYAFFFMQILGITLIIRADRSSPLFAYYLHVVSETTGFAYKEFLVLIMLKWLFERRLVAAAFGSWLLILVVAFVMVWTFNAALALYFKPEAELFKTLRDFNTAAMALPIAFSFTLIIASIVYPTESASDLAGHGSEYAVDLEERHGQGNGYFFLIYAFCITFFIAFTTWKLAPLIRQSTGRAHPDSVGFGDEEDVVLSPGGSAAPAASIASTYSEALKKSEVRHERFWTSIDNLEPDTDATSSGKNGGSGESSISKSMPILASDKPIIKPTYSVASSSVADKDDPFSQLNICWSYVDNAIFAWDAEGFCKESLAHLVNTSGGYTVGCAWYTFAMLSFQNIFAFVAYGRLLGLFLYALFVTSITVAIMERVEKRQTRKWERQLAQSVLIGTDERDINMYRLRYKRNTDLIRVAGRLLCGWSWADFIVACATSVGGGTSAGEVTTFHSTSWLTALIKLLLAILIFAIGAYFEWYRHEHELLGADSRRGNEDNRSSSCGVSLSERNEDLSSLQADFAAEYDSEGEDVEDHVGFNAPLIS